MLIGCFINVTSIEIVNGPSIHMGVSINGGTPIAGWLLMENPIQMDDDWGYPHFRKPTDNVIVQ